MTHDLVLLTDEQIAAFIVNGYLVVNNGLSSEVHGRILDKLEYVYKEEGNPGNNLLPRVPEIRQLFDAPAVRGALTGILGPGYTMHPHRHGHLNRPGQLVPQEWHKDSHFYQLPLHRPWSVLVLYYVQDVTEDMGPTEIMPASQYYEQFHEEMPTLKPCGPAGTLVIAHYDLWHRASLNVSLQDRYMLKFVFDRCEAPKAPSWDHRDDVLKVPSPYGGFRHEWIWNDIWNWMLGLPAPASPPAADPQTGNFEEEDEPAALNAAYALSSQGSAGIDCLLDALKNGSRPASLRAAYGLASAGAAAVQGLVAVLEEADEYRRGLAAFALGMIGAQAESAVPSLIAALDSASEWVMCNAAEALGYIGEPADDIVEALSSRLSDPSRPVIAATAYRSFSNQEHNKDKIGYALTASLNRLGATTAAGAAVPALRLATCADDRYVRAMAGEALSRIRVDAAYEALLHYLQTSRWCADTVRTSTH